MSIYELAMMIKRGRLRSTVSIVATLADLTNDIHVLPVDREVVIESTFLPEDFNSDPADRLIAATARVHSLTLVTADERILGCASIKTIW